MTGRLTKISIYTSVMLQLLLLTGAEAADVYALFNYHDRSEVHFVFSTQTPANPFGKLFLAHHAESLHIDELNRFRLAFFNQTDDFKLVQRRLHRQVFDGRPALADHGMGGHSQHQDQRDSISPDQSGRPVFRSRGAPFSPGPGFMVTPQLARQNLVSGEVEILSGKNWYEIPNSSWYQTWFREGTGNSLSYMIFYDRWEEQTATVRESVWNGLPVARSDEFIIGGYSNYRLLRAKVDGAMELTADKSRLKAEINQSARVSLLQYGATKAAGVKTAMYQWYGNGEGVLSVENQRVDFNTVWESLDKQARFPFMLDEKRLIVMGTDLLHRWLESHGPGHENSECTFCVLVPAGNNTHALSVYSAPDNSLFRFFIDSTANVNLKMTQVANLAFKPCAMTADHEGNLILGGFSVWPFSIVDDEDLLMSVEAIELAPVQSGSKEVKGTILLAQQHYFNIYRASSQSVEPVWLGRLNVGRHLHQCGFVLAEQSTGFNSDVRDLIRLARMNGNSLSAPKRLSEQEQPGQFVLPDQVYMAVAK